MEWKANKTIPLISFFPDHPLRMSVAKWYHWTRHINVKCISSLFWWKVFSSFQCFRHDPCPHHDCPVSVIYAISVSTTNHIFRTSNDIGGGNSFKTLVKLQQNKIVRIEAEAHSSYIQSKMSLLTKIDRNNWNIYQQAEKKIEPEGFPFIFVTYIESRVSDADAYICACNVWLCVCVCVYMRAHAYVLRAVERNITAFITCIHNTYVYRIHESITKKRSKKICGDMISSKIINNNENGKNIAN